VARRACRRTEAGQFGFEMSNWAGLARGCGECSPSKSLELSPIGVANLIRAAELARASERTGAIECNSICLIAIGRNKGRKIGQPKWGGCRMLNVEC